MNLTITVDDEVLRRARIRALEARPWEAALRPRWTLAGRSRRRRRQGRRVRTSEPTARPLNSTSNGISKANIPTAISRMPGGNCSVASTVERTVPRSRLILTVAQEAVLAFIEDQADDIRIGIVAFAGFAELVVPPTNNKDALKKAIRHFFCYIAGIKEHVISWLGDLQKLYSAEVIVDAKF